MNPAAPLVRLVQRVRQRLMLAAGSAVARGHTQRVVRPIAALARCRRGSAAVEMAIVMIPLLTLVFGIISVDAIFYTLSAMQSNAMLAAQLVATGSITSNNSGTITAANATSTSVACSPALANTKAEYYACNGLPSWTTYTVSTTETCATPSFTVSITVDAAAAAIADVMKFFTGKSYTATAVAMKQGSCP